MLIAQGLGEYGALAGGSSTRLSEFVDSVRSDDPGTWSRQPGFMVLGGLLVLWFLFLRK
jgi:hypothetical protein